MRKHPPIPVRGAKDAITVLCGHGYEVERADRGYWVRWPNGKNWRRVLLRSVPLMRMAEAVKLGMQIDGQGRAVKSAAVAKQE